MTMSESVLCSSLLTSIGLLILFIGDFMFNLFFTCWCIAMVSLVSYDAFSVKPRIIESRVLLREALDRKVAHDKVLDASLKEAMLFLKK